MKESSVLFVIFVIAINLGMAAEPNSWHGLILDETTYQDITEVLGEPNKVQREEKLPFILHRIDNEQKFIRLEYKHKFNVNNINLYISMDEDTLVLILLDVSVAINPNSFIEAYDIDFSVVDDREGYKIIGKSENSFVVARIFDRESLKEIMFGDLVAKPGSIIDLPGRISTVCLVSRSVEDKKGLDALE